MDNIFIDGIGLSGYRSFGSESQRIVPFKQINLFIGKNNSGKSNIISFLENYYQVILQNLKPNQSISFDFQDLDYYRLNNETSSNLIITEFGFQINGKWQQNLENKYEGNISEIEKNYGIGSQYNYNANNIKKYSIKEMLLCLLKSNGLFSNNLVWFSYQHGKNFLKERIIDKILEENILTYQEWKMLWMSLKPGYSIEDYIEDYRDNIKQYFIPEILDIINPFVYIDVPKVNMIPAIRKIGEPGTTSDDFSGIGIIDRLAKLQNPDFSEQQKKETLEKINQFLRTVTNNSSATIEIPYKRDMIIVHMDNKTLPLSSLGTGIHEVIILAAAATVLENQIICMEEPELHLHPLLQKKLIRYLQDNTSNQYFITTHSAHLVDTQDVAIFHVKYENNQSIVELVNTNVSKSLIFSELGYRPSDLLQANCIIWVEGPSDRIYLNYWISQFAPKLREKIDYSIMFYGGGLIHHLSISESDIDEDIDKEINEEIQDFISLIKINRNTVVMCDSDKNKADDSLKKAPRRIQEEFNNQELNGFVWITDGREVENYIAPNIMEDVIKTVHSRSHVDSIYGKRIYDYFWKFYTEQREIKEGNKIKIAKEIVNSGKDFETLTNPELKEDLKEQINKLVKFIKEANGIEDDQNKSF